MSSYVSESLERQIESMAYLDLVIQKSWLRPGAKERERIQWKTDMHALHMAEPFYWNTRTVDLVTDLMKDFKLEDVTCSRHVLYNDVAWHYFGEKTPFEIEEYKTKRMLPVKAITWYWFGSNGKPYIGATAWTQIEFTESGQPAGPIGPQVWACVSKDDPMSEQISGSDLNFVGYVDDRTEWETKQLRLFVVAASTFLRQELLRVERTPLERHARKRLNKPKETMINVVQLRKVPQTKHSDPTGNKPDWQNQWTVRGHIRNHYYSTLNEHLPIYIHPYIKGPEGKPLKPRTTPIFSVTR